MTSRTPLTLPGACLRRPFRPALAGCVAMAFAFAALPGPQNLLAASPAGSLVAMFQSGRVPAERAGAIIAVIGNRGNADDLAFLLEMAGGAKYDAAARTAALEALLDAATSRNLKPSGDLASLRSLIAPSAPEDRRRFLAVRLAGLWRVAPLADALAQLALNEKTNQPLRQAAAVSLGRLKIDSDRQTFDKLLTASQPRAIRLIGVEGLAQHDLDAAATAAAQILASQSDSDDPAPLVDVFVNHAKGTDRLAAAIDKTKPAAATARRALEHVYAIGRAEGQLPIVLSAIAGIAADMHLPDQKELAKLVAEVDTQGDATRGEAVFRRATVTCMKCHAVSGAGGNVGPDLSAVGGISPVEFLITSVLAPELAVKEAFQQATVGTGDGEMFQGIVVQENNDLIVLRDAQGKTIKIPRDKETQVKKGGSLMPKGLVNLMNHGDFLDLVRFLSALGKPGPFALRSTASIQRWRYLDPVPEKVRSATADAAAVRSEVCKSTTATWLPAYARVAGVLPLDEITATAGKLLYLKADVQVTVAGQVDIKLDTAAGVSLWVDGEPKPLDAGTLGELDRGNHQLVLRVDTSARPAAEIRAELVRPATNPATFTVLGGP